ADAAVGSGVIVPVEEALQAGQALGVRGVFPEIGPLLEEDANEGLGLAVGLRTVGPRFAEADTKGCRRAQEDAGVVARTVVCEDAANGDSLGGEARCGALQEARTGRSTLIGQDLDVRDPRVVVDGHVEVVIAEAPTLPGHAR